MDNLFGQQLNLVFRSAFKVKMSQSASDDKDFAELQKRSDHLCETIRVYRKQLKANPMDSSVMARLHCCLQECCDWTNYEDRMKKLSDLIDKNLRENVPPPVEWHWACLFSLSLEQQLSIATFYSQLAFPISPTPAIKYHLSGKRLRIGYLCNGAETFPLVGKRSRHNLEKFEIFYYNCVIDGLPLLQTDDERTNQHIVDLTKFDRIDEAACRIAADGIQILVNLNDTSHKKVKLTAIMWLHPAPIQVVYRSDCGSTGANHVEYFITDKVASPLKFAYGYSEKLAYMPNGMYVCDKRELLMKSQDNLKEKLKLRRRFHLPESGIVFGVICRSYRMDPETFECWCEILRRVPGSVLWIWQPYLDVAQSNLKKAAKKHKINPHRLVFVDESVKDMLDLIRLEDMIDVVLDNPMFNCEEVITPITLLIPVVTLPLESFPSRRTASILTSISCRELIAKSKSEYVEIAVNLGNKPELLAEMKAKMSEVLPESNLLRVDQYFNDLENLYEKMWKWREMGEKPEHLV